MSITGTPATGYKSQSNIYICKHHLFALPWQLYEKSELWCMDLSELTDEQLRAEFRIILRNYNLFITLPATQEDKDRFRNYKDDRLIQIICELKSRRK